MQKTIYSQVVPKLEVEPQIPDIQIQTWNNFVDKDMSRRVINSNQNEQVQAWQKFENSRSVNSQIKNNGEQVAAWSQFGGGVTASKSSFGAVVQNKNNLSQFEALVLFLQRYIMSTMPFTQRWVLRQNAVVQFVDAILRGIAQVMFLNNSISGIFICIGMLVSSRYYTLCMLLGVVSSSLTGSLFGLNGSSYANGLYGYNGTLVGVGIAVFSFGDDNAWVEMPQVIAPIILMSMLSTFLVSGIGSIMVGKFGVSPFTIPFILAVWIWILGASSSFTYFPINGTLLQASFAINDIQYTEPVMVEYYITDVMQAVLRGISQVYFQSNTATGVLMLIGIFICSPISAGFALLGSIVSTLTALGLGASSAQVYAGLWGYSAVLSCIATGGMFFVVNSFASVCYAILAGVFSAIIHGAVVGLMSPFGLPALTFAFNIVGWVWCLAGGLMSTMFPVEITAITVPEDHIKRVNLSRKMKSKFKAMNLEAITDIFGVKTHQELVAIEKVLSPVLMCWYASIGDIQQLKELIDLRIDVNLCDYDKRTALHLAAAEGNTEIMELLCHYDAALLFDLNGETAFNDAIRADSMDAIEVLKQRFGGADVTQMNKEALATQLCIAAAEEDIRRVQLYRAAAIPFSYADYDGRTALHIANDCGFQEISQLLIEAGADITMRDNFGAEAVLRTDMDPTGRPIIQSEVKQEKQEFKYKNENNVNNIHNTTRMLITVMICNLVNEGNLPRIKEVVHTLDDITVAQMHDYDYRTPLHIAAGRGQLDIAMFLVQRGAALNAQDRWQRTPLYEAVMSRSKRLVKYLSQLGGSLCMTGMNLAIFLNGVVKSQDIQLLQLALFNNQDVNCGDYDDRTPLHIAGDVGNEFMFNLLLQRGHAYTKDRWGQVPKLKKQ